ncbi:MULTISPECIES: peroxiredoxin [Neisseria]|uniref:thioredoxin-dependent peroxiredoxin n=2 Tax=Neisseria TaxID=482 RepID=A0A5J6Q1R8_9NEIS|nr:MULTISPECIES: peroxiredoxin [Neisseria]MCS4533169.1 peroxiredoxin [Neisseria montereyensis]QEY26927.1 peroxiredoxin [Neisseria zalophi]
MSSYRFTLPSSSGQDFVSDEHLPLIIYFYPKDNTPGCTTEGLDFNARLEQFQALGYTVVGISRDSVKSHQNFCNKQGFRFELLSDKEETVCKMFDVIKLKKLYGKESLGIERSTFVLNEKGEIIHEWRKVKAAGHAQEVLETLSR